MPQISWNEVRDRAIKFSSEWADATREESDKQTFWNKFFDVFGIERRGVAVYESSVARQSGSYGFIDVLWPGVMIVEHKSLGASFERAESQAFNYCADLIRQGRLEDIPRFVVICDFARVLLYDLEPDPGEDVDQLEDGRRFRHVEFALVDLYKHIQEFSFIRGEKPMRIKPEDPANMKATQLLADLHDALKETGYVGHDLERYLVRCLFCLFAEDTGVFDTFSFTTLIVNSREDGSDLGMRLAQLWDVLNTPEDKRQTTLDTDLAVFPYVNGGLFAEPLHTCSFNTSLRKRLYDCAQFCWARISPAVFGSIFQGVMDDKERRQIGAHFTSERDIMKLLNGLCLDELRAELKASLGDRSTNRNTRLRSFQTKLRRLRFFDPACGCGNFLILVYREMRQMEQEVLVALNTMKDGKLQRSVDVRSLTIVDVDQFYGIEINEWPVRIAEVGLWLTDHQCNRDLGVALGQTAFRRLPLLASPTLKVANALRIDWCEVLPPTDNVYILGNPPFVGKKEQNADQKADMGVVWKGVKGTGVLDYVTCWYIKAAEYVQGTQIQCAFVSTNSITQGEQIGVFWSYLFSRFGIKINFAHRTFAWSSEARGKAHVHVVIIGFGAVDRTPKRIFEYDRPDGDAIIVMARNINPYLVEGVDSVVRNRTTPINGGPTISYGSMMIDKDRSDGDDAGLILSPVQRQALLTECPSLNPFIRRLYGGDEFLNNVERWCLWLVDAPPELLRQSRLLHARIETVRRFRAASSRLQTRALAATPTLFGEIRQPNTSYLLVPKVSSENRRYIPMGILPPSAIVSGSALIIPGATVFHFGVLSSAMHNAWMRAVAGRLESRFQYSNNIVYNNFPWPEAVSDKNCVAVETAAQAVLNTRAQYPNYTLAEVYDPLSMPAPLVKAHATLDKAVDRCYRKTLFRSDRERVEHLFAIYERLSMPMIPKTKLKKGPPKKTENKAR